MMEYISSNLLTKVGNFKDAMDIKKEIGFYTSEEFHKFIAVAREHAKEAESRSNFLEWHYYVFFAIAFYTGLRKGEIHGLRWDDIDNDYLTIRRSIAQKLKGDDRETPPKNKSSIRTIQMPTPLTEILDEHKERCSKIGGFNEQCKVCGVYKALRDTTVEGRNAKYANLAGVKKIRIHDIRHPYVKLTTKKYLGFCRKMSLVQKTEAA